MTPISPRYRLQFSEPAGYLDFARFGPPSYAVLDTTALLLEKATHAGPGTVDELMREETRVKAAAARLCRSDIDHVVLQPHTSLGLMQAAFNVAGGSVLVAATEFPANTYPWARAEQAGRLTMRALPDGHVTADRVAAALTDDITMVSVSAVDFRTGYRADLAALRDVVGDRLLVVDGIQGFGVIDEPWEVADILVVGGQKWLRAGWGTGFAVLSDRTLERMDPVLSGWTGARDPGLFDNSIHPPDRTAAAWSISNLSPVTSGAFAAALELVEDAGVRVITDHLAERIEALEEVLVSCGAQIVSERRRRAGILAFTLPDHPAEQVGAALSAAAITSTVRPEHVRLSPHVTTSSETLEQLRTALRTLTSPGPSMPVPTPVPAGAVTHDVLVSLIPAVHGLAAMLGPGNEVLLHDFSRLPDSIVAIAGDLTHRTVGGPMTDLLLGLIRRGTTQDLINYRTNNPDGRPIRSSTLFLRDGDGVAVGCLCVNSELSMAVSENVQTQDESFPPDVDSLQQFLVDRAISKVGVQPSEMKKQQKAAVVRELDDAGFFLIRDSVDHVAGRLDVTRYTIYNYLNEIRG